MAFEFQLCEDRAPQIGLIVLQADETIEQDMRRLVPATVEILVSRVSSGAHVTPDSLAAMEAQLSQAAALFPASAQFSAIGYGCTSAAAHIGARAVAKAVREGATTARVTEPLTAVIAACRHIGARRIGLLSPYIESVSTRLCDAVNTAGIDVCAFASFDESEEAKVVRIAPSSIIAAAETLAQEAPVDALFLSCTNLRALDVIDEIEARTGIPVLTSNQVLAWDLLQATGMDPQHDTFGVLWKQAVARNAG